MAIAGSAARLVLTANAKSDRRESSSVDKRGSTSRSNGCGSPLEYLSTWSGMFKTRVTVPTNTVATMIASAFFR